MISSFLVLVEAYCRAAGIAEATLSSRVFRDGKRLAQIREGADVGARRLEAAVRWLSENWPAEFDWPSEIERPAASMPVEAAE